MTKNGLKIFSRIGFRLIKTVVSFIFLITDKRIQKDDHLWVFPVGSHGVWKDNIFFLYEAVKQYKEITPVIIHASGDKNLPDGAILYNRTSLRGIWTILKCGVIFIHHGSTDLYWSCIRSNKRKIINLWHGSPLKKIGIFDKDTLARKSKGKILKETNQYDLVISVSEMDRQTMANSFHIPLDRVKITGLPRNDVIMKNENDLPLCVRRDIARLRTLLGNKKLISYIPTWRKSSEEIYPFSDSEITKMNAVLHESNATFGIKIHPNNYTPSKKIIGLNYLDLNERQITEMGVILKLTDVLVTDYSGVWVDFLLTNRPIVSFCYDMDSYLDERGFYYDYEAIFPGRINTNFNTFLEDLNQSLKDRIPRDRVKKKSEIRQRFHKYTDGQSAHRVTEEVIRLLKK